jgi:hypothetical protein
LRLIWEGEDKLSKRRVKSSSLAPKLNIVEQEKTHIKK